MDSRSPKVKNFGFTREIKPSSTRRVHPTDDDVDDVSIDSIEQNSPASAVS